MAGPATTHANSKPRSATATAEARTSAKDGSGVNEAKGGQPTDDTEAGAGGALAKNAESPSAPVALIVVDEERALTVSIVNSHRKYLWLNDSDGNGGWTERHKVQLREDGLKTLQAVPHGRSTLEGHQHAVSMTRIDARLRYRRLRNRPSRLMAMQIQGARMGKEAPAIVYRVLSVVPLTLGVASIGGVLFVKDVPPIPGLILGGACLYAAWSWISKGRGV